ncbi:RrF2 family transcriptional regulator [Bacteroidota bacterium]
MQVSTFARYGLRAMIRLALLSYSDNRVVSIKEIAEYENISAKYLESIFSTLKKGKFIISYKGKNGGYKLSRPADSITSLEIVELLDEKLTPINCRINKDVCVNKTGECTVMGLWIELDDSINAILSKKTLQNLVDETFESRISN